MSSRNHRAGDPRGRGNTRDLDIDLVDAQETRRILDRLYGYEVSRSVEEGRSQAFGGPGAVGGHRIIVQRERDRMASAARLTGRHRQAGRQRLDRTPSATSRRG